MSNKMITGQPARDIVREYFKNSVHPTAATFLHYLHEHHLVLIQRPYEAPARRANDKLLGTSHSAALVLSGTTQ